MSNEKNKLSLIALCLMIFTSVFGFANIPRAFFKMGYGAIPWYIIGGIFFFIPFAFMVAELGSAFKDEKGGIYSWMERSVGPTFAFIGTFMWYASYIIWMVTVSNGILAPLSNIVFGRTNLPNTTIISIVAVIWISIVTFTSLKGLKSIQIFSSAGGVAVLFLNIVLLLGALLVLISNGGKPATPITFEGFISSPSPTFTPSLVSFIAFMVYAIFAYGGVESVGGLVDQTKEPEKNFPKGIIVSALIITIGYSVAILFVGFFINYQEVPSVNGSYWFQRVLDGEVHLGNVAYETMRNLGSSIGESLGLSANTGDLIGSILARFTGLSMFLALMGAFFTLIYAPVKQIIEGTPTDLWPRGIGELEDGMPKKAMKIQLGIVITIIVVNGILSSTNPDAADIFFEVLTNMTNISMTLPYLFIVFAFYRFRKNESIEKPFQIFKSKTTIFIMTILVAGVVGFANFFSIIQPFVEYFGQTFTNTAEKQEALFLAIRNTASMIAGPIIFSIIAYSLMSRYKKSRLDSRQENSMK